MTEFYEGCDHNCEELPEVLVFDPVGAYHGLVEFDQPSSTQVLGNNLVSVKTNGVKVKFLDGMPVINGTLSKSKYLLIYHIGAESRNWIGAPIFYTYDSEEMDLLESKCVDVEHFPNRYYTERFGYTALFRIKSEKWGVKWALECVYTKAITSFELNQDGVVSDTKYRSKY